MKNIKGFNELNEAGPHGDDAYFHTKELDNLLEQLTSNAEEVDGVNPKADLLVVYINQYLTKKDAKSIKEGI